MLLNAIRRYLGEHGYLVFHIVKFFLIRMKDHHSEHLRSLYLYKGG